MMDRGIAQRYAKALFVLDRVKNKSEQRLWDFELMIKVLKDHPRLVKLLKLSQITLNDKKKVLQDTFKDNFDPDFMNFLFFLIQKGRLVNLKQIANEYRYMVNKSLNIWEADIVTAVPMDVDSEAKLKEKLEKVYQKKIKINKKIDPKILGGAILIMANEMLDWSLTSRLKKLKENLIATQF